jgi:histidinol-phosphate aminotransferase
MAARQQAGIRVLAQQPDWQSVPDANVDRPCTVLPVAESLCDAAYQEFAGGDPLRDLLSRHENLVILRTLSKALSLAGVRCGALVGRSPLIGLLGRVLPPYCFPTTSQEAVLRLLTIEAQRELVARRARIVAERERLSVALAQYRESIVCGPAPPISS